jgi:hypothetical protein
MSYLYKGINLNTILEQGGPVSTSYSGLQIYNTNFSKNRPYTNLGYQVNGTDISNTALASYTDFVSSTNVAIPVNVKHFRFHGRGGGGGGGGSGGKAVNGYAGDDLSIGGDGGAGSPGGYVVADNIAIPTGTSTIGVIIGTGGAGGNYGGNRSEPGGTAGFTNNTPAPDGAAGGAGNSTYYVMGPSTAVAPGGNPGPGGPGGHAYANQSGSSKQPNAASAANVSPNTLDSNYDNWISSYGAGGSGGVPAGSIGDPGNIGKGGAARIVWLYNP